MLKDLKRLQTDIRNGDLVLKSEKGDTSISYSGKWSITPLNAKKSRDYLRNIDEYLDKTDKLNYFLKAKGLSVKVKDFRDSSRIFAHRKSKEEMVGLTISDFNILGLYEKESKGFKGYICEVYNEKLNQKVKFVFDDLELVLPDLKGYNLPKDRTMRVGCTLQCKGGKHERGYKGLAKDDKVVLSRVLKEYPRGNIQIAEVTDVNNNRFTVQTRDFKVI